MANEDSIERIAADILIATISQSSTGTASGLVDKPEKITEAYKVIHKAVEDAKADSDY